MTIISHQGILLNSSLAVARANPNNKDRLEFFAQIAYPPEATEELVALMTSVTNGAPLGNFYKPVQPNGERRNKTTGAAAPIPGIPADWLIVRMTAAPTYAPAVVDIDGTVITGDTSRINSVFYPGKRVMVDCYAKAHTHKAGASIYVNITGIIAQGDGERLAIGSNPIGALQQYAKPGATNAALPGTNAQSNATAPQGSPFGGGNAAAATTATTAQSTNPFAQAAPAASANPFAAQ